MFCPVVVFACVVHHEVEAHADTFTVAVSAQIGQVRHSSQIRPDLAEVGDSIAAVASAFRSVEEGHQVKVADSAFLNVIEVGLYALQGLGEALGVHHHSDNVIACVPSWVVFAGFVEFAKEIVAFCPAFAEHGAEVVKGLFVASVQLIVEPLQLVIMSCESGFKNVHRNMKPP